MLTKLTPEQISRLWPIVKYAIEEALPPIANKGNDRMNRTLSALMSGELEGWVSYKRPDNKFEALTVTQLIYDSLLGVRNLLIYTLYGFSEISEESWIESCETLLKYAKELNCHSLIAYSANPLIIDRAKQFNADTSFTFISIDVNQSF